MKFENIKVGDYVLINVDLDYGWRMHYNNYNIKLKIERLTPKQMVVGGCKYWREDGKGLGGLYNDKLYHIDEFDDDTEQYNKDKILIDNYIYMNNYTKFKIDIRNPNIDKIIERWLEFKKLIDL